MVKLSQNAAERGKVDRDAVIVDNGALTVSRAPFGVVRRPPAFDFWRKNDAGALQPG
jgi:hypothetical protein